MKIIFLLITLTNLFSFQLSAQKKNQSIQLESLLEQYSKEYYALNPLQATEAGINDYNDQLEITISEEYIKKAKALNQKYLSQLAVINKAGLTESELLSVDMLTYNLKSENERLNNSLGFFINPNLNCTILNKSDKANV